MIYLIAVVKKLLFVPGIFTIGLWKKSDPSPQNL
jgi:hypothetical protein